MTKINDVLFEDLKIEADGFHATPYGHCLNPITADPCPTQFSATNLLGQRENLSSEHPFPDGKEIS